MMMAAALRGCSRPLGDAMHAGGDALTTAEFGGDYQLALILGFARKGARFMLMPSNGDRRVVARAAEGNENDSPRDHLRRELNYGELALIFVSVFAADHEHRAVLCRARQR